MKNNTIIRSQVIQSKLHKKKYNKSKKKYESYLLFLLRCLFTGKNKKCCFERIMCIISIKQRIINVLLMYYYVLFYVIINTLKYANNTLIIHELGLNNTLILEA